MKININLKIIGKISKMMDSFIKKYRLPKNPMIKSKMNTLIKYPIRRENLYLLLRILINNYKLNQHL